MRQLREGEFEQSVELSQFAFQYTMTPDALDRARRSFRPENVWAVFDGDRIAAKLTILPYRAFLAGQSVPMGGVAGVATWPQYRRQGLVRGLLGHSLEVMRAAGQSVSFLYPFKVSFYRQFGWEVASHKLRYSIGREDLPRPYTTPGEWEPSGPADLERLEGVYRSFARRYQGMLDRDAARWRDNVLLPARRVLLHQEGGTPDAYLVYEVRERELRLHETAWTSEAARRAVWELVAQHDSMLETVTWEAPADDRLPFLLANPGFKQEVRPSFMARVVDLAALVEGYRFQPGVAGGVVMAVTDAHAAWNDGTWLLQVDEDGHGSIGRTAAAPGLSLGIGTLSALVMGYLRPFEALQFGQASGDAAAAAWLERVLGSRTSHLFDFF
ncbi:MAG TPA: GNAT family N-acetyltransferase [Deinococcales bacterium]|nr:GNAT family N-acetyltransferase [Deinococcales bacterium]